MKKFVFALLTAFMVSGLWSAGRAQSFVVVDKHGNKTAYDVSKLDSVTFQQTPPGFTVCEGTPQETSKKTTYTFDNVQGFAGNPEFLFAHPDTLYVSGEEERFAVQVNTNVEYVYHPNVAWLQYQGTVAGTDSLRFTITKNPDFTLREGKVVFIDKANEELRDTLVVIQTGKTESHYIDIDWTKTTLDSFNETTGTAQLTFTDNVPEMGQLDVVLLPRDGDRVIRLIDNIQQSEGSKTVTLATREGKMGNLFRNTKFTLATEGGGHAAPRRAAPSADDDEGPVYLPTKVEIFTGEEYVEVYNAEKPTSRNRRAPVDLENEFFSWEYNDDGAVLWQQGLQSLSWDKLNFNVGLKGIFSFDFGDVPFEKVRMGDLQHLKIALEGGFDMEMVLKYLVASNVEWKKEWTLKEDVFRAKYTFMVGAVPVYISVGADLMAEVSLGASGEASITSGIKASNKVTCGVEWSATNNSVVPIVECEKTMEMVGPDVDIKAHAEARATAYPQIKIGIYKVLCPTISPQPYLKAEADGRLVDNRYVAWNAGVSSGIDLGLGLSLDLFFWEYELADIDPVNVFDLPLVSLPDEIELLNEPEEEVLVNAKREVKYHVTNKVNLTGTTYNAPGVLVHFEAEGGELEDEYGYTDAEGNVSAFFTLTDRNGGKITAEVVQGAEVEEDDDAIKADDWKATAIDYRLTATPASQEIEEGATAAITYKLEQYTSKIGQWTGYGGQTVQLEATGGSVAPASGVTAQDGNVNVTFTPDAEAAEGTVTASVAGAQPDAWSKICAATIKMKSEGDPGDELITDEGLKKALKQKPNEYVVLDKTTGETQTRNYIPKWSEWSKDQDNISFALEDADDDGGTLGMVYGFIPLTMTDVVLSLTGAQFENSPGAKFGFGVYEGTELSADFAKFSGDDVMGNISPESKMILRKVNQGSSAAPRRIGDNDYSGEYELLFYIVFKNRTWNPETGSEEIGGEYEVYGRGTMKMHLPTITSFQADTEDDWVKVGESTKVVLTQYYEEGAVWDWNDVQLVASSTDYSGARNGEDEGFFSWDAATQTLTSLKSNDNKTVYICLGLKSNPGVKHTLMVATGEGWHYTWIKTSEEEITDNANSYLSFSFDWGPKDSESERFDYTALEIDPDSNPNNYFKITLQYASQGWPVYVSSDTPPGVYNLRFRIKGSPDVSCTLKVTITPDE